MFALISAPTAQRYYEDMMRDPARQLARVLRFAGHTLDNATVTTAVKRSPSTKRPENLVPGLPEKWGESFPWADLTDALLEEWSRMTTSLEEITGGGGPAGNRLARASAEWKTGGIGGVRRLLVEAFDALDLAAERVGDAGVELSAVNFSSVCGIMPRAGRLPI